MLLLSGQPGIVDHSVQVHLFDMVSRGLGLHIYCQAEIWTSQRDKEKKMFSRQVGYIALSLNIRSLGGTGVVDTYISVSRVPKPHDCLRFGFSLCPNSNSLFQVNTPG